MSEPITKKESSDEVGKNVAYGASSMQGWRISQEVSGKLCRRGGGGGGSDGGNGRDVRARARARPRLSHRYLVSVLACFAGYPATTLVGSARPRRPAPRSLAAAPGDGVAARTWPTTSESLGRSIRRSWIWLPCHSCVYLPTDEIAR